MLVFSFTIFQGYGFSFHLVFRFFFSFFGEWWWDFEILGKSGICGVSLSVAFFCGSVVGWRGIDRLV